MNNGQSVTVSDYTSYCAVCTSLIRVDAEKCPECGTQLPQVGWAKLEGSPYPWLGRVLKGRYLLNQFLGDGATGYVYRAQAMQIHRHFAAKIVDTRRYGKPEFEQELLRRFRMEVEAMSRMRNPHVVNIYEAMQLQDNIFVLVMDFVDGRTLQDLLERVGRIKYQRAFDIVRQIANGLYEAHSLGFIHRDLKPDNIMIERLPAAGFFARVLDFGIVHMMDSVADTAGFRGTPLYASPEQCLGDPKIDHRSDIYSLGCVFFHLLTGAAPFPGTESLRVMDAHVNEPAPSIRDVLPNSRIPDSIDLLLQKMLAKDPAARPQNMQEVIRAIDRLMAEPQLEEQTNEQSPGQIYLDTDSVVFDLSRRVETGDFPAASLGEASSSSSTRIVRPIIEVHLPEAVRNEVTGFTATTLSRNGEIAAAADQLNRLHVLSLKNDGVFMTLKAAPAMVTAVCIDTTSKRLFAADINGVVYQWDSDDPGKPAKRLFESKDRIFALAFDPKTNRLVCGSEKGQILLHDINKSVTSLIVESGASISALAASPTENKVFVGYWGGELEVVDLHSKRAKKLDALPSNPVSMVISDDGYIAAVLDESKHVRILSLIHGSSFFEITAEVAHLRSLAFDKNSQLLGMGIQKTSVTLWDIRNQAAMHHL
ncbi:MAG: WD40 repeat domain-containing serine/threonine protein kinase [bacterium]